MISKASEAIVCALHIIIYQFSDKADSKLKTTTSVLLYFILYIAAQSVGFGLIYLIKSKGVEEHSSAKIQPTNSDCKLTKNPPTTKGKPAETGQQSEFTTIRGLNKDEGIVGLEKQNLLGNTSGIGKSGVGNTSMKILKNGA